MSSSSVYVGIIALCWLGIGDSTKRLKPDARLPSLRFRYEDGQTRRDRAAEGPRAEGSRSTAPRGNVREAINILDEQGRVQEIRGHDERISAIAKEYVKSPENALVVSPDNRSRMEINDRIHAELQNKSVVRAEEYAIRTLVPRQDLTGADRTWAAKYEVGDILRYPHTSKETGIGRGQYAQVQNIDGASNRLTVQLQDGTERTYDPRRQCVSPSSVKRYEGFRLATAFNSLAQPMTSKSQIANLE